MSFNFALASKYGATIQNVVDALGRDKATLSEEQKEHNREVKEAVAGSVRDFARAMLADGISQKDAEDTLRESLKLAGVPKGTASGYGRSAAGFMAIAASGGDMNKANVKEAQDAVASPEQKEKIAHRDALKPFIRDASAAQLAAILEYARSLDIKVKERKTRSDKAGAVKDVDPALVAAAA